MKVGDGFFNMSQEAGEEAIEGVKAQSEAEQEGLKKEAQDLEVCLNTGTMPAYTSLEPAQGAQGAAICQIWQVHQP